MLRKEAKSLINNRAGSRLNTYEVNLLGHLLSSTFIPKDGSDLNVESHGATISVPALADRMVCSDRTVQRLLRSLEQAGLIKTRMTGRQSVYTVTVEQMRDWESTREARTKRREELREEDNYMRRFRRGLVEKRN